ncbi:hypothetical protein DID88_010017 [Monilinia fructigena]|uniref:Uncharacterized protein n=1 Tax=Monilinia fructigena TaxID=38457 RepID=A0A395IQR5_9HELO|nr:hypothetical protein DID88_010017 [Monilinia fructigena]
MFIGSIPRIISSATSTSSSRPAIIVPRISVPAYVHGIRASMPMIWRNYHEDRSLKSKEERGLGDKVESKLRKEESGGKDQRGNGVDGGEKANSNKGEKKGKETVEMKRKTFAEMDEELRAKMEGREGAAGVSYEGGKPVTDGFGRGVKSNMFRVI